MEEKTFPVGRKAQEARMHNGQFVTSVQIWEAGIIKTYASIVQ